MNTTNLKSGLTQTLRGCEVACEATYSAERAHDTDATRQIVQEYLDALFSKVLGTMGTLWTATSATGWGETKPTSSCELTWRDSKVAQGDNEAENIKALKQQLVDLEDDNYAQQLKIEH